MANSTFRPAIISLNGKKIAEVSNSTYNHNTNSGNQYGIEGVLGQSRGAQETDVDFDTVVPVLGHATDLKNAIVNELTVTLSVKVDGGYEKSDGIIQSRSYTSDSKTGECKGKFKFIGGKPTISAA